jgi:acyl transferase domain-containing protein/NAD(P)-dependent dehydrogenase (short-subunit alcohol dehydrogenase family)
LTAPHPEGQVRALNRAYAKAGFSPASVDLIEAHGTGTVAGDQAEMDALNQVFEAEGAALEGCALGSVKSMIGHTKCTAGVASLVKVALALRHKVLPPTLGVKKPNPKARFHESPFYINSEVRPWIRSSQHPRRAGVSAFGFGGTNFHAVLEEYDAVPRCPESPRTRWDSELLVWTAESRAQLILGIENLVHSLVHGAVPELRDLSYSLWQAAKSSNSGTLGTNAVHLALVIDSHDELRERLALLLGKLRNGESPGSAESGVYFAEPTGADSNEVAFLFPGQGSQYPGMLAELAIQFAEIREQFELVDCVLKSEIPNGLSRYILPPPWFTQEQQAQRERALKQTHIAQPALGAADIGMFRLLQCFGIQPSFVAGHSYGEYVALCAAGVFGPDVLFKVSEARGRAILEVAGAESGTMAAVNTDKETVRKLLENLEDVWIANVNSRKQTVISGTSQSVRTAMERMKAQDLTALAMPVSCAFHSPLMAPARERLLSLLRQIQFSPPKLKVFSNTAATLYPSDPQRFADLLADHLVQTVNFADEIEAMYLAGARIFVEVGPRNVLTSLTREILGNRPNVCVATDVAGRSGLIQLQNALGQLYVLGIVPRLDKLFEGRALRKHNLAALVDETLKPVPGPSIWLVNGGCARPAGEAGQHKTSTDSQQVTVAAADAMTGSSIPSGPLPAAAIRDHSQHDSSPNLSPLELSSRIPDAACIPQSSSELSAGVTRDGVDAVMLHFSQLMEKFLETQRDVMLSYIDSCHGRFQMSDIAPITADENQDALVVGAREEPSLPGVSGRGNSLNIAVSRSTAVGCNVVSSNPSRPVLSQERLTAELLKVVNQRTGYPPEMLDLDLDIEANLGIDSIKRVEILADFQRSYLSQISNVGSATIDSLTSIKTLRGIVDHAWETFHLTPSAAETDRSRQYRHATADEQKSEVPRFMLRAVDKTVGIQELVKPPNLVVIVADDGAHVARSVAEQLRSRRVRSIVVRNAVGLAPSVNEYTVDLGNETSVAEITSRIRHMEGPIGGIIHLSALQSTEGSDGMTVSEWRHRLACEAKSLFFFAKATLLDLKEIGSRGTSWLASAVPFNSTFNRTNPSAIPSAGAIRGFVKTVMLEYPEVCCKVIALDTDLAAERLGMQLLDELWSGDREVEVGFHRTRRLVLRPEATALPQIAGLKIDSDWVILVTGGGRGITAEVACHLAKQRPTLLLVGRTPFPVAEEDRETASLSPGELKRWMIARSANASISATPAEIDYDCQKLLNDREMREKVMAMKRTGARVHYIEADVRDEQAITKVVEETYRIYGRLDGVIHGAGVIEDRLFENKTPDSFDRVFHTKLDGAFILSRAVHGESLKFFAFFSSISGIFGNPGQADYAAANAGLDQLAEYLDRKWPSRVFSLAWGPWEKIGMVSESVRQQFLLRGVQIITPTAGVKAFEQELQFGRRGEVQVVLGAGPWEKPKLVPKRLPDVLVGASSEAPTLMMKD